MVKECKFKVFVVQLFCLILQIKAIVVHLHHKKSIREHYQLSVIQNNKLDIKMKNLRDYSKPLMVAEKFSADQYVAICAGPAQYLYADAIKPGGMFGYTTGEDGVFQDKRHFILGLEIVLRILSYFTGYTYTTDGEYMGIRTTDSPSKKGKKPDYQTYYPIYGSDTQLSDGNSYSGPKLNDYLKVVEGTNEYYIQGNMS